MHDVRELFPARRADPLLRYKVIVPFTIPIVASDSKRWFRLQWRMPLSGGPRVGSYAFLSDESVEFSTGVAEEPMTHTRLNALENMIERPPPQILFAMAGVYFWPASQ